MIKLKQKVVKANKRILIDRQIHQALSLIYAKEKFIY